MESEFERRLEKEKARIEARYRGVLKSSVAFEKGIRNRWREKNRAKNARIAELEARVAELERELGKREEASEGATVADRSAREEKLVALMVNDLGPADLDETEVARMHEEARSLPDEELDRTLAARLDLPYPVDAEVLDRALARVAEPDKLSGRGPQGTPGGFTGAPDMSHEPRPDERPS